MSGFSIDEVEIIEASVTGLKERLVLFRTNPRSVWHALGRPTYTYGDKDVSDIKPRRLVDEEHEVVFNPATMDEVIIEKIYQAVEDGNVRKYLKSLLKEFPPIPPAPEGDYLVRTDNGAIWTPPEVRAHGWKRLWQSAGPLKVYSFQPPQEDTHE